MDYFFLTINYKSPLNESAHNASIQFNENNFNTSTITTKHYKFSLNKLAAHYYQVKKGAKHYYLFGRDFKLQMLANPYDEISLNTDSFKFPFLIIEIDSDNQRLNLKSDKLGLYRYFYIEDGDNLYITNSLYAATIYQQKRDRLLLCEHAYFNLVSLGYTLPHETPYQNIKASKPIYDLAYVENKLSFHKKIAVFERKDTGPSLIYKTFSQSVQDILKSSHIRWINLTGGLDTRLIYSTLSPMQRQSYEFFFDSENANPAHIPYDYYAVSMLEKELGINLRYTSPRYDQVRYPKPFKSLPGEGSCFNHMLTGMYGGESLGANALKVRPHHENMNGLKQLSVKHGDLYEHTTQLYEHYISEMKEHTGSEHDLYFHLYNFINATSSRIYNDSTWLFPYSLSQKKISPFINTELLVSIFSNQLENIENYNLYLSVAKENMSEIMQYPLHSSLSLYHETKVNSVTSEQANKIKQSISHQKDTLSNNDSPHSLVLPSLDFGDSFHKEVKFIQKNLCLN